MSWLEPRQFGWAALLGVAVALWLFRPRARTVEVSTLMFLHALGREHRESSWLRRLKRLISFLLSAGVIAGATAALARPVAAPPEEGVRCAVLLVDRSASMAVRDAAGRGRLEAAVAALLGRLGALPPGADVLVVAYDRRPEVVLPRTLDRREAARALRGLSVRPVEGDPAAALKLALRLAALETPATVWHATDDTTGTEDLAPAAGVRVETIDLAVASATNAGITAFEVRRLPLDRARLEAFVQVHYAGPAPVEAELTLGLDGGLAGLRRFPIAPGGRERLTVPLETGARTLTLRVTVPGDVLPADDVLAAHLPEARAARVAWISPRPSPFTELALDALVEAGDLSLEKGAPADWPRREPVDAAVFEGWSPEADAWPADLPVVVIDPPGAIGPVAARRLAGDGIPVEGIRAVGDHPVLYGVIAARLAVQQTVALGPGGALQPLWQGPAGPLLLAGDSRGQRLVVLGFDPARSERLGLLPSFPLLLGNALYWATQPKAEQRGEMHGPTGRMVQVAGRTVTWTAPGATADEPPARLRGGCLELDRVGLWRTEAGSRGSASLLSPRETLVRARSADAPNPDGAAAGAQGDARLALLGFVLAVLLAESWLFHRHGVH